MPLELRELIIQAKIDPEKPSMLEPSCCGDEPKMSVEERETIIEEVIERIEERLAARRNR